jgi:Transmembrane domain of unknown function (DUF3566)
MRITHIAPLSVGKVAFVLYGVIGLIACVIAVPVMLVTTMAGGTLGHPRAFGAMFAVALVILVPLFYAAIGGLVAMVGAFIYNVVAGMVGGVELTIEPAPTAR